MSGARRAVARFWRAAYTDNITGLSAMVAYNLLLSLFPLALVALFVSGNVLQSHSLETRVVADLRRMKVQTDKKHYDKLKVGDRVNVSYRQGKYTGTVWSAEIE